MMAGIIWTKTPDGLCPHYDDSAEGLAAKYPGIPEMGLDWTLDTFPGDSKALAQVRALLDSDKWVLFNGDYGTGKTGLAACIYRDAIDKLIAKHGETAAITGFYYENNRRMEIDRPKFWNVEELLQRHADTWHNEDLLDPVEYLKKRCGLLVLDGVGETAYPDKLRDVLGQLIGQRYTRWRTLRTVMTSNWYFKDFGTKLGDWSVSRLRDVCEVIVPREKLRK